MTGPAVPLTAVLRSLEQHRVEYILFGAAAMVFHGFVRNTEDVDIIVAPDQENLARVADWLVALHARLLLRPTRAFGSRERWAVARGANASVITDLGPIDVVQKLPGLAPWLEVRDRAAVYDLEGLHIPVISRSTLIDLKRRRAGPQDLADIEALELLDEEGPPTSEGGGG